MAWRHATSCASKRLTRYASAFTLVPQGTFLFHATLRDIIRLGRAHASDVEAEAAARAAEAHKPIAALREGHDTVAGELGAFMSSGQRQRIAIATSTRSASGRSPRRGAPAPPWSSPTASRPS